MRPLLSRLTEAIPALDATGLAEAVWLAAHRRRQSGPAPGRAGTDPAAGPPAAAVTTPKSAHPLPRARGGGDPTGAGPAEGTGAALYDTPLVSGGAMLPGTRVRVTQATSLPQMLEIARSLRAFKRPWLGGRRQELDVAATVDWYGRTRQLVPRYRPAPERWFDVAVVVDQSASMALWDQVVTGFVSLLQQIGVFRSVRRYGLALTGEEVRITDRSGRACRPRQLYAPGGRSLILVISDGLDPGWQRSPVWRLLNDWARTALTTAINPLPTRLWRRTGFDLPAVRVRLPQPGASNRHLRHQLPFFLAQDPDATGLVPLPATTLTPSSVGRWAGTLIRTDPSGCDALLMPRAATGQETSAARDLAAPDSPAPHLAAPDSPASGPGAPIPWAVRRVDPFLHFGSPAARRLAVLASVYTHLSLPLLHLIRQELVPEATLADLAELQVSQLVTAHRDATGKVTLRFRGGVRAGLRRMLHETDVWQLHQVLTAYVATSSYRPGSLPAAVANPGGEVSIPAGMQPFAEASAEVLRKLGVRPAPVWGSLPARNPTFTGRERLLRDLHTALRRPPEPGGATVVALHGAGGIGKSDLAREYLHRQQAQWELIWWVPASRPETVERALVEQARRIGVLNDPRVPHTTEAVLAAVHRRVPSGDWLLVLDDAPGPESLRSLLPPRGRVLVTSGAPGWEERARMLPVAGLTRTESVGMLQNLVPGLDEPAAAQLAEELGDVPLALEQAVAWLHQTGIAPEEYLDLLARKQAKPSPRKRAEPNRREPADGYPTPVIAAWSVTLDLLRVVDRPAFQLLRVCAVLAPDPIPAAILRPEPQPGVAPPPPAGPDPFRQALRGLQQHALIRIDYRAGTVQVLRPVRRLLLTRLSAAQRQEARDAAQLLLAKGNPGDPAKPTTWHRYAAVLPHLRINGLIDSVHPGTRALVENTVGYLHWVGDQRHALGLCARAERAWRERLGADHPATLRMGYWHGLLLQAWGKYRRAARHNAELLAAHRRGGADRSAATLAAIDLTVADARYAGDFPGALAAAERRFEDSAGFDKNDPSSLAAADHLAASLRLTGQVDHAYRLDQESFRRRTVLFGDDHISTLDTQLALIIDRRELGDFFGARRRIGDLYGLLSTIPGCPHQLTLRVRRELACCARRTGEHELALTVAEALWRDYTAHDQLSRLDALLAGMQLANCLCVAGRYLDAAGVAERIRKGCQRVLGGHHPYTIAAGLNGAIAHRLGGDVTHARQVNAAGLTLLARRLGADHPLCLASAVNLANDLFADGSPEAAYERDVATVERMRHRWGADHPLTLTTQVNLGKGLHGMGRKVKAGKVLDKVVRKLDRILGAGHPVLRHATDPSVRMDCYLDLLPLR